MDMTKKIEYGLRLNYYLVKYIWPVLRVLVRRHLSKRCSLCTLSEKYVEIHDNVCAVCRKEQEASAAVSAKAIRKDIKREKSALDRFLREARGKGKGQYDALVFFSGGKDSTYLLYRLRKEYKGLRILAFTVDNGFRSPFGSRNAEKVCRYFNVDHMEVRPYRIFNRLYRYGFQHLSGRSFYCIDFWEGELFQDIGRTIAVQHDIPLLILGYTAKQIGMFPPEYNQYGQYSAAGFKTEKKNRFTRKRFLDIDLAKVFTPDEMKYWWDGLKYPNEKIPTVIFPFNVWEYNKKEIANQVAQLKIVDDDNMDPMLTNDLYCTLGVYLDYRIFGYCSIEPEWAQLVREGVEDRVQNRNLWEFVEYVSLRHKNLILGSPEVSFILEKFGMTGDDILEIERSHRLRQP